MPLHGKNQAIHAICTFLRRKVAPDEPISDTGLDRRPVDYAAALSIMKLLAFAESDELLADHVRGLVLALTSREGRRQVTAEQRADLASKILALAADKLPDVRNIQHNGYVVLLGSYAEALRDARGDVWERVASDISTIPNAADRAFVYAQVAEVIPSRLDGIRRRLFDQALYEVENIPSKLDACSRLIALAQSSRAVEPRIARNALSLAASTLGSGPSGSSHHYSSHIIDVAYNIDPELAEELAHALDDDPARRQDNSPLRRQLAILKARDKVAEDGVAEGTEGLSSRDIRHLASAHLASLNANRIRPLRLDEAHRFVARAGTAPLHMNAQVFAWVIENAACHAGDNGAYIASAFEASLTGLTTSMRIADSKSAVDARARNAAEDVLSRTSHMIARPGDRDRILRLWHTWIREHVGNYLKIADRYFGPEQLHFLTIVAEERPDCQVEIMTSLQHQRKEGVRSEFSRRYAEYWRANVSDVPPPYVDIHIVGDEDTGTSPIHDRWMLTETGGLRLGTSINSIGETSVSELSQIDGDRARVLEGEFDAFAQRRRRRVGEKQINFVSFSLCRE